ncbi:hypothetical protein [Flectobacillus roseus]|jgi:hypothetical protein|uniref:hypothetical protein n=1 Tax=Flectobacillus roseus TaxID=502259 RepID=UPI0024B83A88|nr:hypothetical protein [Flectobacillus roseus]MDI9872172.1 hypothetical protein [Flectobacillus roseus]
MNNQSGILGNLGTVGANINVQFDTASTLKLGATALVSGILLIVFARLISRWI